jgi:hypothetical protein
MVPHLTRPQFLDRAWSADDLNAVAEFWLRLYEVAARPHGFAASPDHVTEIRLRGVPRADADRVAGEFTRRAAGSDFGFPRVDRPDPDTLTFTTDRLEGGESPPTGLGLPVLDSGAFDGLMVEFRLTATGAQGSLFGTTVAITLVLVGEVRAGVFVLKTLWRSGSSEWEDELCWHAVWPSQDEFLAALEAYRDTGAVPAGLAKNLFPPRGADRVGHWVVRLVRVPLDKPRLKGLVLRWLIFAVIFGLIGWGIWAAVEDESWFWLLPLGVLAVWFGWLFWEFLKGEARLWFVGYSQFHTMFTRIYEESPRLIPLQPPEVAALEQNAYVRKYTADLRAAGFTTAGDLRIGLAAIGDGVFRVFLAPDGVTYLMVLFHFATSTEPGEGFRNWPAALSLMAHTFYTDGGRAASINGRANGYRRKRTGPECQTRVFPDEYDPVQFVQLHTDAAAKFAAETGRTAVRHERFEQFLRRQEALQDEERQLCSDSPYTWGDHLRWYLQSPRRVYQD